MRILWSALILVCGLIATSIGQVRNITKVEFEEITQKGLSRLSTVSYRSKTSDLRKDGELSGEYVISQVSEYQPKDRWRNVSVWKTPTGSRREERIQVAGQSFLKVNDGSWKKEEKDGNKFTVLGDRGKSKETEIFRSLGVTRLGDTDVQIVESVLRIEFQLQNSVVVSESLQRYWLTADGRFLKEESKTTQDGQRVMWHSVSEYEYDPRIKIEAPIK